MIKVIVSVSCQANIASLMKIPFSVDDFLSVFESYNVSIWPIQIIFYVLALIAIAVMVKGSNNSSQIVMSILAFFWGWMGVVYHIVFFSAINKAAYIFGAVFLLQTFIFLYVGVIKKKIQLEFNLSPSGIVALILLTYSLVVYPLLGHAMGHIFPRTPTFGVPCPTTIFTFGILLYSVNRIPWYLLVIPFLWSIVGFSAALNLSMKEDFGLVIAAALSAFLLYRNPKRPT